MQPAFTVVHTVHMQMPKAIKALQQVPLLPLLEIGALQQGTMLILLKLVAPLQVPLLPQQMITALQPDIKLLPKDTRVLQQV